MGGYVCLWATLVDTIHTLSRYVSLFFELRVVYKSLVLRIIIM